MPDKFNINDDKILLDDDVETLIRQIIQNGQTNFAYNSSVVIERPEPKESLATNLPNNIEQGENE